MKLTRSFRRVSAAILSGLMSCATFAGGPDQPGVLLGINLGLGGAWNTVDVWDNVRSYSSNASSPLFFDSYGNVKDSQNRLAPLAQLGYARMIDEVWLWGIELEYKYLNYNMNTVSGYQTFPFSASSSENELANLSVNLQHEALLLVYFGGMVLNGYFYLGVAPALFSMRDGIRYYHDNSSNGLFGSADKVTYTWGGGAQIGYKYYFAPTWYVSGNYTYLITVASMFSSMVNRGEFSTGTATDSTNLVLSRNYSFTVQEVMFSVNKVFEI